MPSTLTESAFASLGLPQQIVTIVERLGFVTPTPIQKESIPFGLAGRDVLGIAQTGTGKTLAFGLPMVSLLRERRGMGLVVVPTRELAIQVDETLRKVGTALQLKTAVLIGGAPMHRQVQQIRGGAHIIVATPGRLMDHLMQGTLRLDAVKLAVLDEADRMLDMGFLPDIRRIMDRLPKDRQTMLYSATMPNEIASLTREFMRDPQRVEVAPAGTATELVEQSLLVVEMEDKPDTLYRLLTEAVGTVLVFSRTRHGARKIAKMVRGFGISSAELHSDRSLAQRREALEGFKGGAYRVLVATDIAARGIDVKRIELVVNYDVPDNPDDYVHRIGRTGRAGETGRAVTIATPQQSGLVHDVERVIGMEIPLSEDSPLRLQPRSHGQGSSKKGSARSGRPRPSKAARAATTHGESRGDSRPAGFDRGPRPEPRRDAPQSTDRSDPRGPAPRPTSDTPRSTRPETDRASASAPRPEGRFMGSPKAGPGSHSPKHARPAGAPKPAGQSRSSGPAKAASSSTDPHPFQKFLKGRSRPR